MSAGIVSGAAGSWFRDALSTALAASLMALFARTFVLQIFHVPSDSMAPTLIVGDYVVVNKFIYRGPGGALLPHRRPARGDVVVFRSRLGEGAESLVKRCVAVGGEEVALVDKVLMVNDRAMAEPYAQWLDPLVYPGSRFVPAELRTRDNLASRRVPPGTLFVLGDNRDISRDSRSFGAVDEERLIGRAVWILWSQSGPRTELPTGTSQTGSTLRGSWLARSYLGAFVGRWEAWWQRVRWQRTPTAIR